MASRPPPHHLPHGPKRERPSLSKNKSSFCSSELFYQTNEPKKKSLVPTQIPVPTSPDWHSLLVTQHPSLAAPRFSPPRPSAPLSLTSRTHLDSLRCLQPSPSTEGGRKKSGFGGS